MKSYKNISETETEILSKYIHENYEKLAQECGLNHKNTIPYDKIPKQKRNLMEAIANLILLKYQKKTI